MKKSKVLTKGMSVPKALQMVNERLENLKNISCKELKTHGQFKWAPYSREALFINTITNKAILIAIDSYIRSKHEAYVKSAEETFGMETYPAFQWQDCTYSQWQHDLKLRMYIIDYESQKSKLDLAKAKLESHLSEEDRLTMLYNELGLDEWSENENN